MGHHHSGQKILKVCPILQTQWDGNNETINLSSKLHISLLLGLLPPAGSRQCPRYNVCLLSHISVKPAPVSDPWSRSRSRSHFRSRSRSRSRDDNHCHSTDDPQFDSWKPRKSSSSARWCGPQVIAEREVWSMYQSASWLKQSPEGSHIGGGVWWTCFWLWQFHLLICWD